MMAETKAVVKVRTMKKMTIDFPNGNDINQALRQPD